MNANPPADWCEQLHALADAARPAVLAAGWRVRAVCVLVLPEDDGEPLVMRATSPAPSPTPPPTPCRPA